MVYRRVYRKKANHRCGPDYRKEKAILMIITVEVICGLILFGFYAGMYHAVTDTQVSYHAGIVTFELDGRAYEHVASGWYPPIERQ